VPPSSEVADIGPPPQEDLPQLSTRVRRGALWSVLSTLILRLSNIGITAIVAHILAPRDFGVFAVALTAYAIVSSVGQLGVVSCLMRADLDIEDMAPTLVTVSMVTNAILATAMAAFAERIAGALGSADGAGPVRVMALALLVEGVFAVPFGQLTRDFKQDKLFWANAISFIPSTAALLLLAKSGGGAMAFAWSRVITQFVMGCVIVTFVPKVYRAGFTSSTLSLLLKFGIPLAGANFVNYILLNVDYAFVGHLIGAVALGTYVLAFTLASWPAGLLGSVINTVSMPAFSRVKHDPDLLKKAMSDALRAVSLIVMPMCSLMMVLARPIVLTLYGAKWAASAQVLSILSLYGAISIICVLFANMLTSLGKAKFILLVQLIWLGALVPAMAIGVHRNGIVGAAIAHIVIIGPLVLPSYILALRRATGVHFSTLVWAVLPSLLAASAAAFAARAVASRFTDPLAQLITGLVAGGVVYVVAAAPQGIAFLGQERAAKLRALGFIRGYENALRLVRLPVSSRPRPGAADMYQARHATAAGRDEQAAVTQTPDPAPISRASLYHGDPLNVPVYVSGADPKETADTDGRHHDGDQTMSDGYQAVAPGLNERGDGLQRLWPDNPVIAAEHEVTDLAAGLVSVGFIRAALRRSKWFWAAMAVAGLIIGSGLYLSSPPLYQASTTLLLTVGPEAQPGTAILDNQAEAQSRAVAALALQRLGLRQEVGSFLGSYTATVVTDRVLRITGSARSSDQAVNVTNAVAAAFLQFRADQLQEQLQLQFAALDQQVAQGKQHLKSITDQISQWTAQSASSAQQAKLSSLRTQRDRASTDLTALEQTASANKATSQITTTSMITGSKVIDTASPLAHSRYKVLILYTGAGFIIGLMLGVGIVVVRAITSERLYRRDDVARALGAPVQLSIPATSAIRRLRSRLMGPRGLAAAESRDMQRIVVYLRGVVRAEPPGLATLAVVPVDNPRVAALSVVSLAASYAQRDKRVVVTDLCSGSPAARLLGVKDLGVHPANVDGGRIVVVIPGPEEIAPAGPLGSASPQAQPALAGQAAAACASADLLLTLVTLDPSGGAEHLATWATDAVAVVTSGRSSWSKIQAVGELIRLAGTRLVSAVVIGSDRSDESLGMMRAPLAGRDTAAMQTPHSHAGRSYSESTVIKAGEDPGSTPSHDAPMSKLIIR
jgi:lipopolysaccharide exporter